MMNRDAGTCHLTPETRHTGRNKYGIFFKAILWAILITPLYNYPAVPIMCERLFFNRFQVMA
jgi:hypothetical protein